MQIFSVIKCIQVSEVQLTTDSSFIPFLQHGFNLIHVSLQLAANKSFQCPKGDPDSVPQGEVLSIFVYQGVHMEGSTSNPKV